MNNGKLGRTGLDICRVGLSSAGMGEDDCAAARLLINAAGDLGVNLLDVGDADPALRMAIGRAIKGRRDDFVLMGHLCARWDGKATRRTRFLPEAMEAFEDMLERLGTGYLDVGVISALDGEDDLRGAVYGHIMDFLIEQKDSGRVVCVGADCVTAETALLAEKTGVFDAIILEISPYVNGGTALEELCLRCEDSGTALIARIPALSGAALSSFSVNQLMTYALARPGVSAVIASARTPEELSLCGAWAISSQKSRDFAKPLIALRGGRGECVYCGRCAPCPKGIDIPGLLRLYNISREGGESLDFARRMYMKLKSDASRCVFCGACERRCPAAVEIKNIMREARTNLRL